MHLKYEIFPAGGYGGVPQFKKGEEKGHSLPVISKQAWVAVAFETLK